MARPSCTKSIGVALRTNVLPQCHAVRGPGTANHLQEVFDSKRMSQFACRGHGSVSIKRLAVEDQAVHIKKIAAGSLFIFRAKHEFGPRSTGRGAARLVHTGQITLANSGTNAAQSAGTAPEYLIQK